jgi:hypothetical protein
MPYNQTLHQDQRYIDLVMDTDESIPFEIGQQLIDLI